MSKAFEFQRTTSPVSSSYWSLWSDTYDIIGKDVRHLVNTSWEKWSFSHPSLGCALGHPERLDTKTGSQRAPGANLRHSLCSLEYPYK